MTHLGLECRISDIFNVYLKWYLFQILYEYWYTSRVTTFFFCTKNVMFHWTFDQILHFLGLEGPKTSDPSKYIRYIYNRVILENATVRASAVSTLAKFGAMVDSLKVTLLTFFLISFMNTTIKWIIYLYVTNFGMNLYILLQPRIFVLLRRCLYDNDDEVSCIYKL